MGKTSTKTIILGIMIAAVFILGILTIDFASANHPQQAGYRFTQFVEDLASHFPVTSVDILDDTITSADIADGTITTTDLGDSGCADNEVLKWNVGTTSWECAVDIDTDTTFSGANFATSNQGCPAGQKVTGIDVAGSVTCAVDIDTIITTNHVTSATSGSNCFFRTGGLLFVSPNSHGWCPDGTLTDFIIQETSVSRLTSVIVMTIHDAGVVDSLDNCDVNFLQNGVGFRIGCATAPSSSSVLHYVIFN